METRVTYRATQDTVERLRQLAEKYGISQSALLTMLVNERWLLEQGNAIRTSSVMAGVGGRTIAEERTPARAEDGRTARDGDPLFDYAQEGKKKKRRRRH